MRLAVHFACCVTRTSSKRRAALVLRFLQRRRKSWPSWQRPPMLVKMKGFFFSVRSVPRKRDEMCNRKTDAFYLSFSNRKGNTTDRQQPNASLVVKGSKVTRLTARSYKSYSAKLANYLAGAPSWILQQQHGAVAQIRPPKQNPPAITVNSIAPRTPPTASPNSFSTSIM